MEHHSGADFTVAAALNATLQTLRNRFFIGKGMTKNAILIATVLVALGSATTLSAADSHKLFRWVDDHGNVFYGDKIPPEYAKQGSEELSDQGVIVKTNAPPKTEQQRAEAAREAQIKAERDHVMQEKYAHDRMLLNTFSTEDDLIMTRNGKVAALDAMINATKSRDESLKKSLNGLRATAAERERNGQPITPKLHQDITAMQNQIQANLSYIASKQHEQEQLRTQFEVDLQRFRELKAAQAAAAKQAGQYVPAKPQ